MLTVAPTLTDARPDRIRRAGRCVETDARPLARKKYFYCWLTWTERRHARRDARRPLSPAPSSPPRIVLTLPLALDLKHTLPSDHGDTLLIT